MGLASPIGSKIHFSGIPYFWISCIIFRYYLGIHFLYPFMKFTFTKENSLTPKKCWLRDGIFWNPKSRSRRFGIRIFNFGLNRKIPEIAKLAKNPEWKVPIFFSLGILIPRFGIFSKHFLFPKFCEALGIRDFCTFGIGMGY